MTDDFAQMLADIDSILETDFDTQLAVERDPYGATQAIEAALYMLRDQAARIEDLTAQNLRLSGLCYDLKKEVAISDALLISEAEVSLKRLASAEAAEAERDRLREALEQIEITCEEEIRARTAGMSEAALGKSRILPILQVPRNIARAALKGEKA